MFNKMKFAKIFCPFRLKEKYDVKTNKFEKFNIFGKVRSSSKVLFEPVLLEYIKKNSVDVTSENFYYPTIRCGIENTAVYIPSKSLLELKYERLKNNPDSIKQFKRENVNGTFSSYVACPATSERFERMLWAKPHHPIGRWTHPLLYLISEQRHRDEIETSNMPKKNESQTLKKRIKNADMFTLGNKHPSQLSAEQYLTYLYYKEYDRINNTLPSSSRQRSSNEKVMIISDNNRLSLTDASYQRK
ncbi:uncharacterized protein LOC136076902 [Hydra vulgaris]|uniref:Uncharacterized protein LOC136076902 n=1 Tax=Hydra vulgaris TaxID=6087 RepID=A0ABM4BCX6_HYDVU